jgi:hypothetical protein
MGNNPPSAMRRILLKSLLKEKGSIFVLCYMLLSCGAHQLFADSYYSSLGLGLPFYYISARSAGLGGAGTSLQDRHSLNALNPAANNTQGMTTIAVNFQYESVENSTGNDKTNTRQGEPVGFRILVPIKGDIAFIAGIKPLLSSRYLISINQFDDDIEYTKSVRGSGGLSSVQVGTKFKPVHWIDVGADFDFIFGSYREDWKTTFYLSEYKNTTERINSNMHGVRFELGTLMSLPNNFSLGLVFSSGSDLSGQTQLISSISGNNEPVDISLAYPYSYSIGLAYALNKMLVTADYYNQAWTKYKFQNVANPDFHDLWRIGGGLEYTGSHDPYGRFRGRISLRVGGYLMSLPYSDKNNDPIREKFVTFGLGFPFFSDTGRVDVAFEMGTRGELPNSLFKESIFRLRGSITAGERWFRRGR